MNLLISNYTTNLISRYYINDEGDLNHPKDKEIKIKLQLFLDSRIWNLDAYKSKNMLINMLIVIDVC